jgi:hypothetical protein
VNECSRVFQPAVSADEDNRVRYMQAAPERTTFMATPTTPNVPTQPTPTSPPDRGGQPAQPIEFPRQPNQPTRTNPQAPGSGSPSKQPGSGSGQTGNETDAGVDETQM